eukprot:TRINITY_DN11623_c0_g1_i2.p1 TRINITY_DN11623_c0_g1~~TRINITY_DN11623_c0_g1_i2.p1  ORF type:complete len:201 (+),score=48.18 TRINITY_DN11623_c0_g1_i2:274-876(+)
MITRPFREIQAEFSSSKFFLGKNKVMQIALGKDEETEYQQNLHLLGKHIGGECGLLFTNNKPEEVHKFFASFSAATYAKGGVVANEDVILKAGKDAFSDLHGSMEPMVRSLGVPTHLEDEKIVLEKDFQLAKLGEELSVEKAKVLRFLGKKLGEFKIKLLAHWSKSGEYKSYEQFHHHTCLLYTSPSPRDLSTSRMPSSA